MDRNTGQVRVLLVAPLAPPTGGIATWTSTFLESVVGHPGVRITHVNSAVLFANRDLSPAWIRLAEGAARAARDAAFTLTALLRSRPHLIHIATTAGPGSIKDLLMGCLARVMGVRVVVHYHDSKIADQLDSAILGRVGRAVIRHADLVIVLDHRSLRLLAAAIDETRLRLLPNMVDVSSLQRTLGASRPVPRQGRGARILYLGAILERKGLAELVEACAQIPEVELTLVGRGGSQFQRRLVEIAGRRGGGEWLVRPGGLGRQRAVEMIAHSDVLVLPSWWDLFPMSVLEAMAMGKPVVVSDQGALPQIIDAESAKPCGLCVPAKDTRALRDALRLLVKDENLRNQMGAAGLERALRLYDAPVVTAQLVGHWTAISDRRVPLDHNQTRE